MMISFDLFFSYLKNSKDATIVEKEAKGFYDSIGKLGALLHAIQRAHKQADSLVERDLFADLNLLSKSQLPFLKKIANSKMDIYHEANEVLLNEFLNSIKDEILLQDCRISRKEVRTIMRITMSRRLRIYKALFEIGYSDILAFRKDAEKLIEKKKHYRRNKTIVGVAIFGTLAATAALKWFGKEKETTKETKKETK